MNDYVESAFIEWWMNQDDLPQTTDYAQLEHDVAEKAFEAGYFAAIDKLTNEGNL